MTNPKTKTNKSKLRFYIIIIAVVVVAAGVLIAKNRLTGASVTETAQASFEVERRDLTISVTESGEVEARYTTDITCQVEGRDITIIYLIDEGTILTEQDVENGTILVELDSSNLKEQEIQKDMSFNTAKASYEEAVRNYEIQIEQNISDITAARLREEFALMDLRKYLGTNLAEQILVQNNGSEALVIPKVDASILSSIDEDTKGEALQNLRDLQNSIENAEESLQRADSKFQGTLKLFENDYVTKMERDADEAALNQARRNLESRKTALELFLEYDFDKQAKQLYSNYQEAIRQTKRARAMAEARLAQADARQASADVRLRREEENLNRIKKSLSACIIRAPAAGMVVYSQERGGRGGSSTNFVQLGGTVRDRQKLITIPSTSEMAVKVKVHEAWVDMVEPNQVTLITLDAYPDQTFTGEVYDVALLPSSQDRWMSSSDLKVYETMVSIDGAHSQIRDGMSAKVEIIIKQLTNAICVPIQAVANVGDTKVCYVLQNGGELEARVVEVGAFNSNFIEIKSGLAEGEQVSLVPKRQTQTIDQIEQQKKDMIDKALEGRDLIPSTGMRRERPRGGEGGRPQFDRSQMEEMMQRGGTREGRGGMRDRQGGESGGPGRGRGGPGGENNRGTREGLRGSPPTGTTGRELQDRMPPLNSTGGVSK